MIIKITALYIINKNKKNDTGAGMKHLYFLVLLSFFSSLRAQDTDTLYILQTTDVHGHIRPYDYFRDKPADYGLAGIYTKVKAYRQQHRNVILVDGGDLIQGTPMAYYFNHLDAKSANPIIQTLNFMKYDALAVGNHDIEQGPQVYLRCQRESDFPWLSANSLLADSSTFFKPYTTIQKNGVQIGIIGLTTPGIPMWLDSSLYPGIDWQDMLEAARKYVQILRPRVDILVGLFHAGFDSSYSGAQTEALGLPNENASGLVARQVAGFDIIFAGHSHRPYPPEKTSFLDEAIQKPLQINAGSRGKFLGVAEIIYHKDSSHNTVHILAKNGWLEDVRQIPPAAEILDLTKKAHEKTLKYIRATVAELRDTLDAAHSRFEDNALVELINKAQMDYFQADFSLAASFNPGLKILPGKICIKDIYGMYRYENFLYLVQMSGQQIKDFLEYSARFYLWDGTQVKANPNMAGYNYDMAEGLSYQINVRKAPGSRTENIIDLKSGRPLDLHKKYRVAMNSYRASGGGGHMAAAGLEKAKILKKSNREMRGILADYLKKTGKISTRPDGNWKIITN